MTVATLDFENLEFMMASEMDASDAKVPTNFNISPQFDVEEVTGDDESDDKFIYAYTVSGVSKNNRDWTPDVVRSIGQQVLDKLPVGHLGHIKPNDAGFVLPDPQVVWFGSVEETLLNGQVRMWLKGYILPTAQKAKVWIKSKAINSISVWGKVNYVQKGDINEITDVDLKSIDLSRKLGEGLPAFITGIAGEQEEVVTVSLYQKWKDAFEMDGSYNQLIENVRKAVRAKHNSTDGEPYRYFYVCETYPNYVIAEAEGDGNAVDYPTGYVKIPYTIENDIVTVSDEMIPVVRKIVFVEQGEAGEQEVVYEEVTDEDVSEMKGDWKCSTHKTKAACKKAGCANWKKCNEAKQEEEAGEMAMTQAIAKLTISDIKLHNPALFTAIKEEIMEEVKMTLPQNSATAGEQENHIQVGVPQAPISLVQIAKALKMPSYAGEQDGADTVAPSLEEVVNHATQIVATNEQLTETQTQINDIVEPLKAEGEDSVQAITNLVTAKVTADNQQAITNVLAKFDELTANVKNEVLLEYIKEEFNNVLLADAENLEEGYEENAIKLLEDNIESVITKHVERINKLTETSRLAGEMSAVASFSLGNNLPTADRQKTDEELTPEELAEKLGY